MTFAPKGVVGLLAACLYAASASAKAPCTGDLNERAGGRGRRVGAVNYGASSAAAATAPFGRLVAQLYVAEWGLTPSGSCHIDWKTGAIVRRTNGSTRSATFEFRIGEVCIGDLTDDRFVNGADLGMLLNAWGPCIANCPAVFTSAGVVNGDDLGVLLSAWGPCPS
jgi:hypothetical protein